MSVLMASQLAANMRTVVSYASSLGEELPCTRQGYFAALNRLQAFSLEIEDDPAVPRLVFDLSIPHADAVLRTLRVSEDFGGDITGVPRSRQPAVASGFHAAMRTLDAVLPAGADAVRSLVGMVLVLHTPGYVGGSFWHLLGGVWFSPTGGWTTLDYAANLLHESVHQAMFLDDMVNRLFTEDPGRLSAADAQVVSAIRGAHRPLHYAFHAATVAAVLAEFYACVDEQDHAERLRDGLAITLPQLDDRRRFLSARGNALLDAMQAG